MLVLFLAAISIASGVTLAEMKKGKVKAEKLAQIKNEKTESRVLGENTQEQASKDPEVVSEKNQEQENPVINEEIISQPAETIEEKDYTDDLTPEEDPDDIIEDPEMEN